MLTDEEFELVINALQQPNPDHQLLLNLEDLQNLNVRAVSEAVGKRNAVKEDQSGITNFKAAASYKLFLLLVRNICAKLEYNMSYEPGKVYNPTVGVSLLKYSHIGRLYMSLPLRASETSSHNRGLNASESVSQRILDLKLVFPRKLETHTFNDLFKISLKCWREIDQELSKNLLRVLNSDDWFFSWNAVSKLIPDEDYIISENCQETDLQNWYNALLIHGWKNVICARNLLPELKAVRVEQPFHVKSLHRSILSGNHLALYQNESDAYVLSDMLRHDEKSIHDGADLHGSSKADITISEDFGFDSTRCPIALTIIQIKIRTISEYFDEEGRFLGSSFESRIKFAKLLRQAFRYLIDMGTVKAFIVADDSSQVFLECCFQTQADIIDALERLDTALDDGYLSQFNIGSKKKSSPHISQCTSSESDQTEKSLDDIAFIPLLKFTVFKDGVCELMTESDRENLTEPKKLSMTFQSFLTGYVMSQHRRIKKLRQLETELETGPNPDHIRSCDELTDVSELLTSRTIHRMLYKRDVTAGTDSFTNADYSQGGSSATSGVSGQRTPAGTVNYTENKFSSFLAPSICNISKFYEPSQNNSKPFCFKPLQAGAGFYSVVLLFQTRDIITYFPELLAACPQIINFEKVVLKTYDKSQLVERYLKDKYANVRENESFDMFFNRYEKMADQEVRAMSRIMEHNSSVGDETMKVNIPQLLCYGNIKFDTYVSRWGPSDLHGPYLLTEYLEQDGLSDAEGHTGDFEISDAQYEEGVAQLQTLRKLGILHNDLQNRKNLIIKNNHLYFIDFGLSSFLDDDGSERVQYQFDQELGAF